MFAEPGRIVLDDKPIPDVGPLDALICGTDVHILLGEYKVARGLTIGREPVGIIEKLGSAVIGYEEGTHRFALDQIEEACDLFSHQRDGVVKVAIRP